MDRAASIGITTYVEDAHVAPWDPRPRSSRPTTSAASSARAARALLVPPNDDGVEETLDALDGLIFSGGNDLDPRATAPRRIPRQTGRSPSATAASSRCSRQRSRATCRCSRSAAASQVLNVARGGDLVQHLPEQVGHEEHRAVRASSPITESRSTTPRGSAELGSEAPPVKSHHHQGFGRVGSGLSEAAWADDGTVEALEDPEKRFARRRALAPRGGRGREALRGARRGGAHI